MISTYLQMQLIRWKSKMTYLRKWNNVVLFYFYIVALSLMRIPFLVFHRYQSLKRYIPFIDIF